MISLEAVTEEHIMELVDNIRDEEREEIYASDGVSPQEAISSCLSRSYTATAFNKDNTLLGIFGCGRHSLLSSVASPWLLTTKFAPYHPRELITWPKVFIKKWSNENDILVNFVDARYEQSVRWAKKMGFTVYPAEPHGFLQLPFHRIEIRRD